MSVWIGGNAAHGSTTLGAGPSDGSAYAKLDFEHDLGFGDRSWSPRVRADFLVGDSQGLSLDYYHYGIARTAGLAHAITWAGDTYDANAFVRGKLGFDFGSVAWRRWIGHGNDAFGLGLGAGYYKVAASIAGEARVDGTRFAAESASRASAWAPLLQLGWRHAFNERWRMYFDASGVRKNGGRLYGHIYNLALGMQWFPATHVGVSAEYGAERIRLHQARSTYHADLDLRLAGPSAFVTFRY